MDWTPVGAKTPYPNTLTIDLLKRKERAEKEYVQEDPESDPSLSDSSLIESYSSEDSKYLKNNVTK